MIVDQSSLHKSNPENFADVFSLLIESAQCSKGIWADTPSLVWLCFGNQPSFSGIGRSHVPRALDDSSLCELDREDLAYGQGVTGHRYIKTKRWPPRTALQNMRGTFVPGRRPAYLARDTGRFILWLKLSIQTDMIIRLVYDNEVGFRLKFIRGSRRWNFVHFWWYEHFTRSCLVWSRALARCRRVCCVLLRWLRCTTPCSVCGDLVVVILLDGLGIMCALRVWWFKITYSCDFTSGQ